ncbi:autotransporter domain-containing protein [Paludibacterium purpuratum]|uniref:Outer membrane autotransporter protein n=1 Tax=Paludibacterium purpuratum TaxID=1144873 RepID=A0A4R7AVA4_9NEIS|nr:autotransporter domain-containing protein [Paludibacterium purpuratum]TDR71085.1 outer membrane autotransporter protein [Paludibacterium purpuratum]
MNRIHRTVWNEARQSFVVTHENAATRGKPSHTHKAALQAVTAALLALGASDALAVCSPISSNTTISSAVTGPCTVSNGASVTVSGSGSITGGTDGLDGLSFGAINNAGSINGASYGITSSGGSLSGGITNSGTIVGTGIDGIYLQFHSAVSGDIVNSGLIQGQHDGINLRTSTVVGNILNTGTITSTTVAAVDVENHSTVTGGVANTGHLSGATGIRVRSYSSIAGGITNSGSIAGVQAGIFLRSHDTVSGGITNAGTISSSSSSGVLLTASTVVGGIHNLSGGNITGVKYSIYASVGSSISGGIVNDGTLMGGGTFSGIEADRNSTISGGIVNHGTVTGAAAGIGVGNVPGTVGGSTASSIAGGIANSGLISGTTVGIGVVNHSAIADGVTNSGSLTGGAYGIAVISHGTIAGGVTNTGTVNGGQAGVTVQGNATISGGLTNAGTIQSATAAIQLLTGGSINDGIFNQRQGQIIATGGGSGLSIQAGTINGGIHNSGLISSAAGAGLDIYQSTITGGISNDGTILGANYYALEVDTTTLTGGITNSGFIHTTSGDGIRLSGTATLTSGGITNLSGGTISGTNGIYVETGSHLSDGISNAGLISGTTRSLDLNNTVSGFVVANSGMLQGDANIGINSLNLNGTSARVIGNVTGASGTVNVNGTFTSEGTFNVNTFNIASGGLFNIANGVTVGGGHFNNSGVLNVGTTSQTITGAYSQAAGGAYRIGLVDPTSNYGKLHVTGNATLASGTTIDVNIAGSPAITSGTTVQGVLVAGGTLTATPANITVTDNSALYNFTASTTRNAKEVDLVAAVNPTAFSGAVDSNNNSAGGGAAGALQTMLNTGIPTGMQPVFDRLSTMTSSQVSNAVSQMLPALQGAMPQAGMSALHSMNKIIQSRIESNHGLSSGDAVPDKYLWVRAFGNHGDQDDRNGVPGFKSNTGGLVIGADAPVTDRLRAGGAFTYARSTITGNSGTAQNHADVDTYELAGYASYNLDQATDINAQLDVGQNKATSRRQIDFMGTTASADIDSLAWHGSLGIGRTLTLSPQTTVTPSIRLDYTQMETDGYSESGAGPMNLQVQSNTYREFLLTGDMKGTHQLSTALKLVGNISVGYDFINKQAQTASTFTGGGPAFVTNGLSVSPWVYRAGFGLIKEDRKGWEYSLRYDVEGRTSGYLNQTVSARVRWAF